MTHDCGSLYRLLVYDEYNPQGKVCGVTADLILFQGGNMAGVCDTPLWVSYSSSVTGGI